MSKLSEDLRIGILGAAAGLFSISVVLLIARIDTYYTYLSWLEQTNYATYDKGVERLWWIPAALWHLLLSVVASLLVHRYLTVFRRSPFLLWQVIGMTSLLGWGLTLVLVVSMEAVMNGNLNSLQYTLNSGEAGYIAKYVAAAFASNVFYGSVMQASSRQYREQFDFDEHPKEN